MWVCIHNMYIRIYAHSYTGACTLKGRPSARQGLGRSEFKFSQGLERLEFYNPINLKAQLCQGFRLRISAVRRWGFMGYVLTDLRFSARFGVLGFKIFRSSMGQAAAPDQFDSAGQLGALCCCFVSEKRGSGLQNRPHATQNPKT